MKKETKTEKVKGNTHENKINLYICIHNQIPKHIMKKYSGHIVDIKNEKIFDGIITIEENKIVSIEPTSFYADNGCNDSLPYILPGFIDAHVHIESSMLLPENFAKAAVRHGTIGIVTDPHEIANVLGLDGVRFMIENGKKSNFYFCFGAPSCVPSTTFETAGATLGPDEVRALLEDKDIGYLSEFMFAAGVVMGLPDVMAKLQAAKDNGKPIDGHSPGFTGEDLKKYIEAGVSTDHECTTIEEGRERLKLGMKILIRNGSAAQDFEALSPLLAESKDMLMFCSDDKHPDELLDGHINLIVKKALKKGYPFWNVLRAACVTPVEHYHMDCGQLQEGDNADFILADNLSDLNILKTVIRGEEYLSSKDCIELKAYYGGNIKVSQNTDDKAYINKFNAQPITEDDIKLDIATDKVRVIVAKGGTLLTDELIISKDEIGKDNDILKLVVYNRYTPAKPQVAYIKGFGLEVGALCSTVAHDSHNIVAVGVDDASIVKLINHIIGLKGGIAVYDGQSIFDLPLPVAGLISPLSPEEVSYRFDKLLAISFRIGCQFESPFMTMSFMALPVIPKLKLTDMGLFDGTSFGFVPVGVE